MIDLLKTQPTNQRKLKMEYVKEKRIPQDVLDYFYENDLDRFIENKDNLEYQYRYHAGFEIAPDLDIEFPPDVIDLVRMHRLVRDRNPLTIMEFGVGYSTLVYADAMKRNKAEFDALPADSKRNLVWQNQFEIHSIDSSNKWLTHFRERLSKHPDIEPFINLHYSTLEIGTFGGQICHFYTELPDVVPDFIYLDGPCAADVQGHLQGMTFKQLDRTVMAGDILRMESILSPGTFILVDGRKNNGRFLANHFKRNWRVEDNSTKLLQEIREHGDIREFEDWNHYDYMTMELAEFPVNFWNYAKIKLTSRQIFSGNIVRSIEKS